MGERERKREKIEREFVLKRVFYSPSEANARQHTSRRTATAFATMFG